MHFTIRKVNVSVLQKNYSLRFCDTALISPFVALFPLMFQRTPHATLPQLPAFLQMSSTPFPCWQWTPYSACDGWSRVSSNSLRKALQWAANASAICCTEGCSHASATEGTLQVTAINALRLMFFILREILIPWHQAAYLTMSEHWQPFTRINMSYLWSPDNKFHIPKTHGATLTVV